MTNLINDAGRMIYQLGFQISPIIFTGGIAQYFGGYLPVIAITETGYTFGNPSGISALNAISAIATTANNLANTQSLDDFFAQFSPVSGSKLANYTVATYPFASNSVAANATISQPLTISVRMSIPVNKPGGHISKMTTMLALQASIKNHANAGGMYTVVAPASIYTNLILTGLTDVSGGSHPIPQNTYQWDFIQPLVTLQQSVAAQNTLMDKLTNGLPTSGSLLQDASSLLNPSTITGTTAQGVNPISVT